jgi:hypothetical protein
VQLLACNYLPNGYRFYTAGEISAKRDPKKIDEKLIAKYAIDCSRATRTRKKQQGKANVQYLRYKRFFVLISTPGKHDFFAEEAANIQDIRRVPLRIAGYSISYRRSGKMADSQGMESWHSHVQIDRARYMELQTLSLDLALRETAAKLAMDFYRLPFEPYVPVRRQMFALLRAVNRTRVQAGLTPLSPQVLPLRRRIVYPFGANQALP